MAEATSLKLLAALNQLGQRIDMSTFSSRLIFQKKVYLLQELGLSLGNSFGWYVHGPYSKDAANIGFQLAPIQDRIHELPELTADENNAIQFFRALVSDAQTIFAGRDEAYYLELLASLHFVLKYGYPRPETEREALNTFSTLKPQFVADTADALDMLNRNSLSVNL